MRILDIKTEDGQDEDRFRVIVRKEKLTIFIVRKTLYALIKVDDF